MTGQDRASLFARHYRGRHLPQDALWWLDHPEAPGPSSAEPPARVLSAAVEELRLIGMPEAAEALAVTAREVLRLDALLLAEALARAGAHDGIVPLRDAVSCSATVDP